MQDTALSGNVEPGSADVPLAVDLDGTFLRTDVLLEGLAAAITRAPWLFLLAPFLLLIEGKAGLKRRLARAGLVDLATLPVRRPLAEWLAEERARGRKIYLVSASDQEIVDRIAAVHGLFDGAIGSDGHANLKGPAKRDRLQKLFPEGYAYVGDAGADIAVWKSAQRVSFAGRQAGTLRKMQELKKPVERIFFERAAPLETWAKAARVHQWAKNALIFAAPIVAQRAMVPEHWLNWVMCLLGFLIINLLASSTYILNDLADLSADRQHWSKRNRPFASGALPISIALILIPIGIVIGAVAAVLLDREFAITVGTYLVVTLAYSFKLKQIPVVDVLTLATLFTLRLLMGLALINVEPTPWILGFCLMLFLSLSLAKRHVELHRKAQLGGGDVPGRGYRSDDAVFVLCMGVASGFAAILVVMLYVADKQVVGLYKTPHWLWALPVVFYVWLGRIWFLCHRGRLDDDPVLFAIKDPLSIILGFLAAGSFALAALA
ncbi:MAG: UbiA family prenyltransferase [Alphaproteobacteria bacterium]|nr:UbiA family prenyltransferase [Alphaproteobacteria bacterium]